ncbi:efflux RND transporter periplasmic adaptor subunit [Methylobacterium sp. WL12]|uniref:efflux RND transporter periplasmic adaptor subunit n=1 Tax=unclassified Methylobacterium TaxID=2615210 RepID=UPI0011C84A4F|nr:MULTISPECIES: efflux RND transporter periplasmic adaptor subunit [unclassified Methylobacterium]MCJ2006780.1 efflux RND transporter periplasmic adaptor subunit [Methylobacterium sp. J-092]TXM73793.1 efflux RND transporter periplasmic adaptor subunit [Methylobacterium sp. WL12]
MSPFIEPDDAGNDSAERAHAHAVEIDPLRQDLLGEALTHSHLPPPRKRPFVIALLALGSALGLGGWHHWQTYRTSLETQEDVISFVPTVRTVSAVEDDKPMRLTLPGQTEAFDHADIFARATGYIAERRVDIGSRVKKGDLLVRIAAPDLDQQKSQAEAQLGQLQAQLAVAHADVEQAKANVTLANATDARTSTLAGQGWASKQTADQTRAQMLTATAALTAADAKVKVAEANITAQQATVDRLRTLTTFENVTAPFDGIVVARMVDVGDLVHADLGSGASLFSIESTDLLRVSVQVPQSAAVHIRDGVRATVQVAQMPERSFQGTVSRSSVALRSSVRTLDTEVDVANPDGALRPGLYVNVTFAVPRAHPGLQIPSEALIFDAAGTQVAVVQPDDTVKLHPITISRDLGTTLELRSGLKGGDTVVLNPPADLRDGSRIVPKGSVSSGEPVAKLSVQASAE